MIQGTKGVDRMGLSHRSQPEAVEIQTGGGWGGNPAFS